MFSPEGAEKYSELAGKPIKTVDDLASAIKDGSISAKQIPLDYVNLNGQSAILNTRTSAALNRAGVLLYDWYGVNKTGVSVPGMTGVTFDKLAELQILRNKIPETGTSSPHK